MKISTKTRYGMRFMIDLAQSQGEGRVALKDIADRQGLSKKYLEQVVAPLASAGLLDVTRGNQGGYRLSRDASAITLADIVAASEDGLELLDCMGSLSACERAEDCRLVACGAAFKWRSAIISPGSPSPTSPLPPPLPTCNLPPDLFRVSCVITCAATREDAVEDEGKKYWLSIAAFVLVFIAVVVTLSTFMQQTSNRIVAQANQYVSDASAQSWHCWSPPSMENTQKDIETIAALASESADVTDIVTSEEWLISVEETSAFRHHRLR